MSRRASKATKDAKHPEKAAQRRRRPAAAPAVTAAARATPFGHPSTAPRRRHGPASLEREADRTVDAVLSGAVGLAHGLTGTRPARVVLPGSAGRPLPAAARTRLEHGLGADLSRVRLHDDAAAHALVAEEGAAAFVAGPDVYLGPDAARSDTDEGFRLLAHEVVHTLQQTGRAAADGRRRVTDARGPGDIQTAADMFLDRFASSTPSQVFDTVTEDHGGTAAGSPIASYQRVVAARLKSEVDPMTEAFQDLASDAEAGTHGATTPAEQSFLLDLMKAGQEWEAAAVLIENAAEPLATRFVSEKFAVWLFLEGNRPKGWAAEIVETTPTLRRYRDLVYGAFRIFLVRPDRGSYALGQDAAREMYSAPAWTTTVLAVNERISLAALFLTQLEGNRHQLCLEVDRRSGSTLVTDDERERAFGRNPVFRGWRRAGELQPPLQQWTTSAKAHGEPIQVRGIAWFEERRQRALVFWQSSLEQWGTQLTARLTTGRTDLPEERRTEMRRALTANPVAVTAAERVSAAGVTYLAHDQAELPDPSAYADRLATFRTVLDGQITALYEDLSLFRLEAVTEVRAALVPWLVLRLEWLRQQTLTYVAKDDVSRFDDTRHGHRLLMSTELRRVAYELDDSVLEEAAEAVQHNEAGTESRLVLISDWERPASSDLDQLERDFGMGVKFSDYIVLDPRAIAAFYREAFLHRLADSIEMLLDPSIRDAVSNRLVLKESFEAARQAPSAVRWSVKDVDWAPRSGDPRWVADIIAEHPKSVAQLPPNTSVTVMVYPGQDVVGSLEKSPSFGEVFAWELPAWDQLAAQSAAALAGIPELKEYLGPVGTDPVGWLNGLDLLMGFGLGPSQDRVRLQIWEHLRARAQAQRARLGVETFPPGLLREATNHDRAVVAARVSELLGAYDARVGTWDEPLEALDLIEQFHRYAAPATDNLAQTTALIVDVASAMRGAFVRETFFGSVVLEEERYDLVTGYYGFLVVAQRWLKEPDRRALLTKNFLRLSRDELATREADLAAVREAFERVQRRIQSGRGFESTADGGLRSLNYPFVITTDHQFGTTGSASFQLMRVFTRFRFHPRHGEPGEAVEGVDKEARPAEVLDPTTKAPLLPPDTELFEIRVNDRPMIVKADQLELLDTIWRAVEEKAFQLSMENLQQAMKDIGTLAIDLVELVPGAGQAVMVGRIVLSIATFLASADFDDIKAIVTGELVEQINELVAGLETMLNSDEIWMYLLFGSDNVFLQKLAGTHKQPKKPRPITKKPGRLGLLLRALLSLGSLIARQVELMRERVQPPLRSAQSYVVGHPLVAAVVNLAAEAIAMGPQVAEGVAWLAEFAGDPAKQFADRVEGLVSVIEQFELPDEIIPNAILVAAVIGLILDRFGTKGKLLRRALDATGAMAEISEMVADALPEAADPNRIWVEEFRPIVDKVLNDLRQDLIDGVYGALALIGLDDVAQPEPKKIEARLTAGPDHEEDEAAEPALAPGWSAPVALDHLVPARGGDVLPPGPGTPLPAGPRASAEAGFGRSFDHVRLHRATLGEGVDALTRGSHVVMRPGLSLDAGQGEHVLRHELTHVVQHTGDEPHPLPTRGRAGTAVRFDPAAEAQADRVANGAGAGAWRRTAPDAADPALSPDVVERMLKQIASFENLREYQKDISEGGLGLPSLDKKQRDDADAVAAKLVDALKASNLQVNGVPRAKGVPGAKGSYDTEQLTRAHAKNAGENLQKSEAAEPTHGIRQLVRRALDEDTTPTPGTTRKKVQARRFKLDVPRLKGLVESYLLIRNGLRVDLDLPLTQDAFEKAMRNPAKALDIKVTGVFLGAVIRTSPLWKPIFDDQLRLHTVREGTPVSEEDKAEGLTSISYEIADEAAQTALYRAVVDRLRKENPYKGGLKDDVYELTDKVLQQAVDTLAVGLEVKAEELPPPSSYLRTELNKGGGEFGLRVKTHGELTPHASKSRHSHHTTQYLFAEYLTHRTSHRPLGVAEPGVEYGGGRRPEVLHRADGGAQIQLGKLHGDDSHRGDPMPAILVARTTHQSAGLHIAPTKPTQPDDRGRTSQSSTIHTWFRKPLTSIERPPDAAPPKGSPPSAVASMPEPAKARNKELVAGVENVYREMRGRMLRALKHALVDEEKPYYEAIAARRVNALDTEGRLKPALQLDPAELLKVYKALEENNYKVMKLYGVTSTGGPT